MQGKRLMRLVSCKPFETLYDDLLDIHVGRSEEAFVLRLGNLCY